MILITAGAFISSEFQVELGKIPPVFLPLGNKRLYEHQIKSIRQCFPDTEIFISIIDAYQVQIRDKIKLSELGVELIYVPEGLTLGESVLYSLNSISRYDETLKILHGDTYIQEFPTGEDVIGLAEIEDQYAWEIEAQIDNSEKLWCGFFAFSDIKLLAKCLTEQRGNFILAIRSYQHKKTQQFLIINKWLDLGHVNTYFRARGSFTTERHFNRLKLSEGVIKKTSALTQKIFSEANWFRNLPPKVKRYSPQIIQCGLDSDSAFYELEYLPHLPLNELYVYGNLPILFWKKIFKLTNQLLMDFSTSIILSDLEIKLIEEDFHKLITQKTWERLNEFISVSKDDIYLPTSYNGIEQPSIHDIVNSCQEFIATLPSRPGILHGDLCFSNLLFDSRSNILKVIDPRGLSFDNRETITGDLKYDIAKYVHSVIGLYDHIVAGCYTLTEPSPLNFTIEFHVDNSILSIQNEFTNNEFFLGFSSAEVLPISILLFISMLPLHYDNPTRQRALLANAIRLFWMWRSD